ncbi:MAG: zinc ribbon domain-containing protein [Verrucomicrobiota bacterium]
MVLYEYDCNDHGRFEAFSTMAERLSPAPCPECGQEAPRAMSLPRIKQMATAQIKAMDRSMKSRQEPHVCGSGCSHSHSHNKKPKKAKEGLQSYTGARPWVIEHA